MKTLSNKRKELKDLMLMETLEDKSQLAIMFKSLVIRLFEEIENQDKQFIKDLKNKITHLLDTEEDTGGLKTRAIIDKLAGNKLIEEKQ